VRGEDRRILVVEVGVVGFQAKPLDATAQTRPARESGRAPWAQQAAQLLRAVRRVVSEARAVAVGAVVGGVPVLVAASLDLAAGGVAGRGTAFHGPRRGP
jgi:hypothetical protein